MCDVDLSPHVDQIFGHAAGETIGLSARAIDHRIASGTYVRTLVLLYGHDDRQLVDQLLAYALDVEAIARGRRELFSAATAQLHTRTEHSARDRRDIAALRRRIRPSRRHR
jgi:hypothetical protein